MLIIDGHAHVYSERNAEKIISSFTEMHRMEPNASMGKGTPADLLAKMEEGCVNFTVTANFAAARSIRKINEWTLALSREHPALIPLVSVNPEMKIEEIEQYFQNGARGIKMHNGMQNFDPMNPGLTEMYEFCQENRIAITFHCGETSRVHMNEYAEMSHILPVLKKYPGIPFVLTHLAAGDPAEVKRIAEEYPNALFDTSITFSGEHCIHRIHDQFWESDEQAAAFFHETGCDRFAFGSDYPFGNPAKDIERFMRLPLEEYEKECILGLNTKKLYFD